MADCSTANDFDGRIGLRVSSIFVILVGSFFGAAFPVYAKRHRTKFVPEWTFFVAKFFGSGVIIATAFIHLLAPAADALTSPCLTGVITQYDWAEGIALMSVFSLFFVELLVMRAADNASRKQALVDAESAESAESADESEGSYRDGGGRANHVGRPAGDALVEDLHARPHPNTHPNTPSQIHSTTHSHTHTASQTHSTIHSHPNTLSNTRPHPHPPSDADADADSHLHELKTSPPPPPPAPQSSLPGTDHLSHSRSHTSAGLEAYAAQLTALFILEFGIIFHSIFVGLTLAVAGAEFTTLYIVLVFHQTFEGLGLGSRLAAAPWPPASRRTPYLLAAGFAVSTPLAVAVGLGVRQSYAPGSQVALVVNGVCDSVSAGILIYTGLVELMAHEFMFSERMRRAPLKEVLAAFGCMVLGAGLMALLGRWA